MFQNAAYILIGLGVLALLGWGIKDFFMASDIHVLLKIAAGAIGVGVLTLIIIAIKDRAAKAKTENFKGVEK